MKLPALLAPIFGVATPTDRYRPDIDGLRALAVLAVIAYHYFPSRLPGGFIGVDVFFVISGYLITGILARSFEKHSFGYTLGHFYQHRIRRIFPAVAIVLAALLVAGWLLLFPDEYKALGAHVAAGAGFVENLLLYSEAGYFDAAAIQKPLLHFWSLAVEEQFYIFWPFVLWFAMRRKWPLLDTIAAIIAASLALGVWMVWKGDTTAAFYLPYLRAWELMAGAWLAIAHRDNVLPKLPQWLASQSAWLGLALILMGFAAIRPTGAFPGFWALLPVLGSALILHAGAGATFNRRFLSWRPAVWIGLISYPLYLWHWVLWSMVEKVLGPAGRVAMRNRKIGLIVLSILLAWLVYKLVETPVRKRGETKAAFALIAAVIVIGGGGLAVTFQSTKVLAARPFAWVDANAVSRYLDSQKLSAQLPGCFDWAGQGHQHPDPWHCALGDKAAFAWILVIGDSHAAAMLDAVDRYGREHHVRVVLTSMASCIALQGTATTFVDAPGCAHMVASVEQRVLAAPPAAAVLIQRWDAYADPRNGMNGVPPVHLVAEPQTTGMEAMARGLRETLAFYQRAGVPVLILQDNPEQSGEIPTNLLHSLSARKLRFAHESDAILNASAITFDRTRTEQASINAMLRRASSDDSNAHLLNIDPALCTSTICPWVMDGQFLYHDSQHLSVGGAQRVYPLLASALNTIFDHN